MKQWRVVLSESAKTDIRNVHDYIAFELLSPESASMQTSRILDAIERLADFPEKYPLCRIAELKNMGLRAVSAGRQRVFYSIIENSDTILIVRVLYERRDAAKAFLEELQ